MRQHPDPATWIPPMTRFIEANLPVLDPGGKEWDHMFTTAYQFGCDALIAFGQAEETGRGARPLAHPRLPDILPRWDDICVTVLSLASQCGLLSYRLSDGRKSPEAAAWWGRREGEVMPQPNITAAHGLGPAKAAPEVLPVLCALGLVESGQWAAAAEPVLWRVEPPEWRLDIAADPRFRQALERAVNKMPEDIRRRLDRLVTITEADVTEGLIRREAHQEGLRAEHGANRVICLPLTRDSMRQGLIFLRIHDLDWLFFSNWRLSDGWLSPTARKRAMEIFHDSIAIRMRRAVVRRLYPDRPEFSG
ncbi:pellino [Paracoccus pantotrophus]|nr:pellino [Paracoccus pantotrophus]